MMSHEAYCKTVRRARFHASCAGVVVMVAMETTQERPGSSD